MWKKNNTNVISLHLRVSLSTYNKHIIFNILYTSFPESLSSCDSSCVSHRVGLFINIYITDFIHGDFIWRRFGNNISFAENYLFYEQNSNMRYLHLVYYILTSIYGLDLSCSKKISCMYFSKHNQAYLNSEYGK